MEYVYIAKIWTLYKIGVTRHPKDRVHNLRSVYWSAEIVEMFPSYTPFRTEFYVKEKHKKLFVAIEKHEELFEKDNLSAITKEIKKHIEQEMFNIKTCYAEDVELKAEPRFSERKYKIPKNAKYVLLRNWKEIFRFNKIKRLLERTNVSEEKVREMIDWNPLGEYKIQLRGLS